MNIELKRQNFFQLDARTKSLIAKNVSEINPELSLRKATAASGTNGQEQLSTASINRTSSDSIYETVGPGVRITQ